MKKTIIFMVAIAVIVFLVAPIARSSEYPNPFNQSVRGLSWANDISPPINLTSMINSKEATKKFDLVDDPFNFVKMDASTGCRQCMITDLEENIGLSPSGSILNVNGNMTVSAPDECRAVMENSKALPGNVVNIEKVGLFAENVLNSGALFPNLFNVNSSDVASGLWI